MRRVLIVDDDPKVCETLDRYLAHAGYATASALDGAKALELVQTFAPDLIVETVNRFPGDISIVATGPLTNVAQALMKDPARGEMMKESMKEMFASVLK